MKTVVRASELPPTAHKAILVFDSVFIPGDERSRTNPGHGYPDRSENICKYYVFDNDEELRAWIERNAPHTNFALIDVVPRTVRRTYEII